MKHRNDETPTNPNLDTENFSEVFRRKANDSGKIVETKPIGLVYILSSFSHSTVACSYSTFPKKVTQMVQYHYLSNCSSEISVLSFDIHRKKYLEICEVIE